MHPLLVGSEGWVFACGNVYLDVNMHSFMNICNNGTSYRYNSYPTDPLASVMDYYDNGWMTSEVENNNSALGPPVPWYVEQNREEYREFIQACDSDASYRDICYHLLQLYCSTNKSYAIEQLLCTSTWSHNVLGRNMLGIHALVVFVYIILYLL
jgi:hypothetical protein